MPRLIEDFEGKVMASHGQAEPEAGSLCARSQYKNTRIGGIMSAARPPNP